MGKVAIKRSQGRKERKGIMKEYIKANGSIFECSKVLTGAGTVSFYMESQSVAGMEQFFRAVSSLSVAGAPDAVPYGAFENLAFQSASVYADGSTSVSMRIKSETEMRLEALEESQEIQDGAITEIGKAIGGEA